jgi:hypothetical protein
MILLFNFIGPEWMIFLPLLMIGGLWIWAIVDIIKSEFEGSNDKVLFLLLVLLFPFVGTVIYFIIGRPKRINSSYS